VAQTPSRGGAGVTEKGHGTQSRWLLNKMADMVMYTISARRREGPETGVMAGGTKIWGSRKNLELYLFRGSIKGEDQGGILVRGKVLDPLVLGACGKTGTVRKSYGTQDRKKRVTHGGKGL